MLVTHQWTFLVNIGYIFHVSHSHQFKFLYEWTSEGNDCIQKSFDGIFILPDKV